MSTTEACLYKNLELNKASILSTGGKMAVSYTHLDVYKRQGLGFSCLSPHDGHFQWCENTDFKSLELLRSCE